MESIQAQYWFSNYSSINHNNSDQTTRSPISHFTFVVSHSGSVAYERQSLPFRKFSFYLFRNIFSPPYYYSTPPIYYSTPPNYSSTLPMTYILLCRVRRISLVHFDFEKIFCFYYIIYSRFYCSILFSVHTSIATIILIS